MKVEVEQRLTENSQEPWAAFASEAACSIAIPARFWSQVALE